MFLFSVFSSAFGCKFCFSVQELLNLHLKIITHTQSKTFYGGLYDISIYSVHAPEAYLRLVNLKIKHNTGVAKHWVVNSYFLIIIQDYVLCWWGIGIQIIFSDFAFICYKELSTPCVVFMNCLLVTLWGKTKNGQT